MEGIFHRSGAYLTGAKGHRRVFHWDLTHSQHKAKRTKTYAPFFNILTFEPNNKLSRPDYSGSAAAKVEQTNSHLQDDFE